MNNAFCLKYPLHAGVKKKNEVSWISILHVCERLKQPSQGCQSAHTHTLLMWPCKEENSPVYGLCNINPRKYYWKALHKRRGSLRRKPCRAIFKNTIWPEMPFETHRLIPTGEKEIEVLLEIPLQQYAVTATAPGLHLPLETITEDLRNFGLI